MLIAFECSQQFEPRMTKRNKYTSYHRALVHFPESKCCCATARNVSCHRSTLLIFRFGRTWSQDPTGHRVDSIWPNYLKICVHVRFSHAIFVFLDICSWCNSLGWRSHNYDSDWSESLSNIMASGRMCHRTSEVIHDDMMWSWQPPFEIYTEERIKRKTSTQLTIWSISITITWWELFCTLLDNVLSCTLPLSACFARERFVCDQT